MKRKTDWIEVARRGKAHALLFIDTVIELYKQGYFGRAHRVRWNPRNFRQFDDARWWKQRDMEAFQAMLEKATKNGKLAAFAKEYERRIRSFKNFAERNSKINYAKSSTTEIEKVFSRWFELTKRMWCFAYDYIFINRFLPDIVTLAVAAKVSDFREQSHILGVLFEAISPSQVGMEKQALLELAFAMRSRRITVTSTWVQKQIDGHVRKFAHLGLYYFRGAAYTHQDIQQRLKEYLRLSLGELKKSLDDFKRQAHDHDETAKLVKRLRLSRQLAGYIAYIKRWAWLSSFADETYGYGVYLLRPLWDQIQKRLGVSYSELISLTGDEVRASLRRGKIAVGLKQKALLRNRDHAIILQNGKKMVLEGAALRRYYKKEKQDEESVSGVKELKGQAASPGYAAGRVRLVFSSHDVNKVGRGDILVAAATNPTYVPAMERAAAIITDEGGLLSHAAIVSRELKIPCIVGTRIATRALRDGDTVEVDATTGIIHKL